MRLISTKNTLKLNLFFFLKYNSNQKILNAILFFLHGLMFILLLALLFLYFDFKNERNLRRSGLSVRSRRDKKSQKSHQPGLSDNRWVDIRP